METFASFNYVNELAATSQTLKREIAALEKDCEELEARNRSSTVQTDAKLETLKEDWQKLEAELAAVKVIKLMIVFFVKRD